MARDALAVFEPLSFRFSTLLEVNLERSITVGEFVAQAPAALGLRVMNVEADKVAAQSVNVGVERLITSPHIQKLGLALAGFNEYIDAGRVQIISQSEVDYFASLTSKERARAVTGIDLERIACILITRDLTAPVELVELAGRACVPLLLTALASSVAIGYITEFLHAELAPREVRHGVMLEIYGLGVLIEGRSGIGKSECALDLLTRGHRLVADDAVEVRRLAANYLRGSSPAPRNDFMEIRGLGIINVRELFGVQAVSDAMNIDLSLSLEPWAEVGDVDRLGLDLRHREILGVDVPHVLLPVSTGRNLAVLVETAARVHHLRLRGRDAAHDFVCMHDGMMRDAAEKL